ncbi:four helix bundle protein [Tichowtungia aerotolerans]|uniref:Four helix bundle protein n=1 Tax=Tichowtungia aerotolerans TaxID=2697043 RepID=A0A6P1M8P9_9BACT|nr:four helix bundle protein [Tichowtungia aerotolerans]QHI67956.1 four helix bundle protein [Tichowtungia aerotolerans]
MRLRVWQDARDLYLLTWKAFRAFPFEQKRIASQQVASIDSIHRNISEGYCRRSIKEYLQYLNIAQGSVGESVSTLHVYCAADHISEEKFEETDALAYKLENDLKKLIGSLQEKQASNEWDDSFLIKESNESYTIRSDNPDIP